MNMNNLLESHGYHLMVGMVQKWYIYRNKMNLCLNLIFWSNFLKSKLMFKFFDWTSEKLLYLAKISLYVQHTQSKKKNIMIHFSAEKSFDAASNRVIGIWKTRHFIIRFYIISGDIRKPQSNKCRKKLTLVNQILR